MAVESYVNAEEMDEMVKTLFHYHDIIDDCFVDEGFNNVRMTTFSRDGIVATAIRANGDCIRITTVQDGEVVEIVRLE